MKYRQLSSIFYENKETYDQTYKLRYESESTYRFGFKVNGDNAFVVINHEILSRIQKLYRMNESLNNLMDNIPQIALTQYTRKCLIDEIKMTNEIEGVVSTRKEIKERLDDKSNNKGKRLQGLVNKYNMLSKGSLRLETCKDIRDLYDELVLREVLEEDSQNKPDGRIFREGKVYIKNNSYQVIHEGVIPEDKIIDYMSECLNIINNENFSQLISIAVFHYMFGYIHPFYDGNGRMSRFISSYLLVNELNFLVSYRLSYIIKENIKLYYRSFKDANNKLNKGEITHFVMSFFDILIKALEDLSNSIHEKNNRLMYYLEIIDGIVGKDKIKLNVLRALVQNSLFGESGLSVKEIHEITENGESKIRSLMKELSNEGLIEVFKEGRINRYKLILDKLDFREEISE